jgi:hypothetical protein
MDDSDSDDEEDLKCVDCGDYTCYDPGVCGDECDRCDKPICKFCYLINPYCSECLGKLNPAAMIILRNWTARKPWIYLKRYISVHKALKALVPKAVIDGIVLPFLGYSSGKTPQPKRAHTEDDEDQPSAKRQRRE